MPPDLLLAYYGDDFTGSTDALEALARSGVRTVLFLRPPTPGDLARFPGVRAVGLAGTSRSMAPEQMDAALPPAFAALQALGAPILHYKVCSTFDSAPAIGSIGRAIEIGRRQTGADLVPVVVGAPALGRYCVFGNLFARSGPESAPYRLDRHPTMRRHPVTPMDESDLRLHLARQTALPSALLDVLDLADAATAAARLAALRAERPAIVLCDTLTDAHLTVIGGLLQEGVARRPPLFVAGSSGVEYALTAHWRATGVASAPAPPAAAPPVETIVAVSGSCSPVTAAQVAWAATHDFAVLALEPEELLDDDTSAAGRWACQALSSGRSVLLHTCAGPDDPRRARLAAGRSDPAAARLAGARVGAALGRLLRRVLETSAVRRVAVAGGDTAGAVVSALELRALEMIAPLAPGSPLCRADAPGSPFDGLELVLKGGQVGRVGFFNDVWMGTAQ